MTAIPRAACAALLALGLGSVPMAGAIAQTTNLSADSTTETDGGIPVALSPQDLQQLTLDRQQVVQSVQQLRQDQASGDQASVLLDEQAVGQARLALIAEQLAADRNSAAQTQMPANVQAALTIRDQYLTAEQLVIAAQIRITIDRQTGNGGQLQADQMGLKLALAQTTPIRQEWVAVRARFATAPSAVATAPSSAPQSASTTAQTRATAVDRRVQPVPIQPVPTSH